MADPILIAFPLRGEGWVAVTSPADRVPSHGTDRLGQRHAFDLIRTDERPGRRFHPAGALRTLLLGVPTHECHAWGAPVHAPFSGVVVAAIDRYPERLRVHPVREAVRALWTALTFSPDRLTDVMGNHVILRADGSTVVHAGLAHLAPGSVAVRRGDHVEAGQVIGAVGHSGNSTSPHLHVQLMDAADPVTAAGLPCAFATYEVQREGGWVRIEAGIPGRAARIRSAGDPPP